MTAEELIQALRIAAEKREDDDVLFASLLTAAADFVQDKDMSSLFTVGVPTVNRWRMGRSTPHPIIKQRIYEVLAANLEWQLQVVRGAKFAK